MTNIDQIISSSEFQEVLDDINKRFLGFKDFLIWNNNERSALELFNILDFSHLILKDFFDESTLNRYEQTKLQKNVYKEIMKVVNSSISDSKLTELININSKLESIINIYDFYTKSYKSSNSFSHYSSDTYSVSDFMSDNGYDPDFDSIDDMYGFD